MKKSKFLRQLSFLVLLFTFSTYLIVPSAIAEQNFLLPTWAKNATIYEVNVRQYSADGTFASVTQSLLRLQKLGVGIIWLMPINPISQEKRKGTLGSPYSVADYKGINSEFGSAADLHQLIDTAHRMGMHVIIDWVANHSGWDNPWIKNTDWYHTNHAGEIIPPNSDWSDVAWLNYDNLEMRAAMIDAMKYWVTEFDIDGFRADVAGGVPVDFWEGATTELRKIKPLFMLAEDENNSELLNKAFSANYNWKLLGALNDASSGQIGTLNFISTANFRLKRMPAGSFPMNFITNHDENSWNGSEFKRMGNAANTMAALTFTYPGMPLIYSGQEVGNQRELQFFEKDQIPNLDRSNSYTQLYTKLVALKRKNSALWTDAPMVMNEIPNKSFSAISFYRTSGKNKVLVFVNGSNKAQKVEFDSPGIKGKYINFSTGKTTLLNSKLFLNLKPWQFEIYSTAGN